MPGLSIGAYVTWQYAAGEAVEAGHPYIEAQHLFLGILSLGKALTDREGPELRWNEREQLRVESEAVGQVFSRLGLEIVKVRRSFRGQIGWGSHVHGGDIVHRSQRCRAVFARAQALAGQENLTTALHLLTMVALEDQTELGHLLREVGILPGELAEHARSYTAIVEPKPQLIAPPRARDRKPRSRSRR